MKIGNKEIEEIIVKDDKGNLLVSITDLNIINHDSIRVELVESIDN